MVVERTAYNTMMEILAKASPSEPSFEMERFKYTESILGHTIVYVVAGYVSPNSRVLRIQGSDEFALVIASGPAEPDHIAYSYRSELKGVFEVRLGLVKE